MPLNPFGTIAGLAQNALSQSPFGQLLGMTGGAAQAPMASAQPPVSPQPVTPVAPPRDLTGMPGPAEAPRQTPPQVAPTSGQFEVRKGENPDLVRVITQRAQKYGVDPNVALRVARAEGGLSDPTRQSLVKKNGRQEPSYGPFQLLIGGGDTGFPEGMGNQFMRETGLDPRDPKNAEAAIDFAMLQASKLGWGQWYGAKAIGLDKYAGIGGRPVNLPDERLPPQAPDSPMKRVLAVVTGGSGPQVGASPQTQAPGRPAPTTMERVLAAVGSKPSSRQQPQVAQTGPSENNLQEVAYRKQKLASAAGGTPNQPTPRALQRKADLRKRIGLSERT